MANPAKVFEQIGRRTIAGLDEMGYAAALFLEAIYWTLTGWRQRQPVRVNSVFAAMTEIGVAALPIATLLAATIGLMLAIQSLYSLGLFGAEQYAFIGIALSVVREFSPMIMGILVAGRSGSAIAARLATMNINQEVDALVVMGINPTRFLVSPVLLALVVMMPCLAMWANMVSILSAGLYVSAALSQSFGAYLNDTLDVLKIDDVWHGLGKAALFGIIIALVGVVNGSLVKGGAEGVGRVTTRSVVLSVTLIVVADMIFAYLATR
ncbi:MlaE family ABC transporter permease [Dongia sp.]|uniref:MlaE family ABC transporter permease n=1 Tax=Dongia sp. TaxID=1977262 RepID=UPI0035B47EAE